MTAPILNSDFALAFEGFDSSAEGLREALTSTGNGYFCTRGSAEWEDANGVHYPGTYTHGGYNRETTVVGGLPVLNEDLVNLPNWTGIKLRIEGGETLSLRNIELLSYRHEYDFRQALVVRTLRFLDRAGRETTLRSRRFVSMASMHQAAMEWILTPENWSGSVEIISAVDGRVTNAGVARYRQLESRHLERVLPRTFGPGVIALEARTRQSRIYVAEAARTEAYSDSSPLDLPRELHQMEDYIQQVLTLEVGQGQSVRVEKIVALYTSRDPAISEPLANAGKSVRAYPLFSQALSRHRSAWEDLWRTCDLVLPADSRVQRLLRFHTAHVLQVCSRHTTDIDAGVPARGLNGEAYRGHILWDELYVLLYLSFRLPSLTRHILLYRARRLGEARRSALAAGYRGAMFPWQSGSDGQEEAQVVHLNPISGSWEPDHSYNQRHVNAAIFYTVWHYYLLSGDLEFMLEHGAELMLEITRFFASIAHYNPDRDRYEIHGVMGPDEFHESYPGAESSGLRNNAYTNVMVAWICDTALKVLEALPGASAQALANEIGLSEDEVDTWRRMSQRMFVPFHSDGIISQFEGYELLDEFDWEAYQQRYDGNIQRLDRILRAEGDDPGRYKLAKQADAVMLFFLFSEGQLREVFERLDYPFVPDTIRKTIAYYDRRTSHGSTLSYVSHAGAFAGVNPEVAWERFRMALEGDISDIQGGTTQEGIHMGLMAGTLDLIQRGFLGTEVRGDVLTFSPRLTGRLDGLSFQMRFRGAAIQVSLDGGRLTITALPEGIGGPVAIGVGTEVRRLLPGQRCSFEVELGVSSLGRP